MKIIATGQPPGEPHDKPQVEHPVYALLACPCLYTGNGMPGASTPRLFCAKTFAETVLTELEQWALKYGFTLCHLGGYVARKARHMDGSPILPVRWSNHAYGTALDWAGVLDSAGIYHSVGDLKEHAPQKYHEIVGALKHAITTAGQHPEIVEEGGRWLHVGYFTKGT